VIEKGEVELYRINGIGACCGICTITTLLGTSRQTVKKALSDSDVTEAWKRATDIPGSRTGAGSTWSPDRPKGSMRDMGRTTQVRRRTSRTSVVSTAVTAPTAAT